MEGVGRHGELQVRTAERLPVPGGGTGGRADLVVFVVDMKNRESLRSVLLSLRAVSPDFFVGRAHLVVVGADAPREYAFPRTDLETLTYSFNVPVLFAPASGPRGAVSFAGAASRLLRSLAVAARRPALAPRRADGTERAWHPTQHMVSPLLMQALDLETLPETRLDVDGGAGDD